MNLLAPIPSKQPDYVLICEDSKSIKDKFSDIFKDSKNIFLVQSSTIKSTLEAMAKFQPHLIVIGKCTQPDTVTALLRSIKSSPNSHKVPIMALSQDGNLSTDLENDACEIIDLLEPPEFLKIKVLNIIESHRYFFQESESLEWLRGMQVIVVEDSKTYTHLLKHSLSKLGINAINFENGLSAWEYLSDCKLPPDLIISDILMPEMTGMELVKRIRTIRKFDSIPIIISSNVDELNQLNDIFELGANDYFTKPFHFDVFLMRIKAHLKTHNLMMAQLKLKDELSHSNQHLDKLVKEQQITNSVLTDTLEKLQDTQNKLIESEKMASLGGLVTGIAHEINTPLGIGITSISHMAELLQKVKKQKSSGLLTSGKFDDFCAKCQENINIIQTSLQHGAKLVNNFKMVSVTQSSGELSEFKIKSCLQDALHNLDDNLKQNQHTIALHCSDDLIISSYPDAFHLIINNLVLNSIVHGFANIKQGQIEIRVTLSQGQLKLEYHDNGIGMDNHTTERVFDPFFTTKRGQGSVGLGTHIIYNLVVQRLHGNIHCTSEPGKGCTFTLLLPLEIG